MIAFDHLFQTVHIISHIHLPSSTPESEKSALIKKNYEIAVQNITALVSKVQSNVPVKLPKQVPIGERKIGVSNVGEAGYKSFVKELKDHIIKGDIIQAVPSQRLKRETNLHPFNAYR